MITYWPITAALMCLLGTALWFDIVDRRVPNRLVVVGLVIGTLAGLFIAPTPGSQFSAISGLGRSLLGALVGLAVMLPLYLFRTMGAGDVKLMAAVGAFLGPMATLGAALLTFAAGGVLSLIVALRSGALKRVRANLWLMGMLALTGRSLGVSLSDVQTTGRLPYAAAITAGTALQLWLATQASWPFK